MNFQITIKAKLDQSNICEWYMEVMHPSENSTSKIVGGKLKHNESVSNQVSFIAEQIATQCKNELDKSVELMNLKFEISAFDELKSPISKVDFFKLYGLLTAKLNPLTIITKPILMSRF